MKSQDFGVNVFVDFQIVVKAISKAPTIAKRYHRKARQIDLEDLDPGRLRRSTRTTFWTRTATGTHVADVDFMLDAILVPIDPITLAVLAKSQESPTMESRFVIVPFVSARFAIDINLAAPNLLDMVALDRLHVTALQADDTIMAATVRILRYDLGAEARGGGVIGFANTRPTVNFLAMKNNT
ncbi:hypothetical protein V8J82_00150 [Gymnodinialimonas sp. 2305UL16-5]|uniref:hypothetical protein n=1 Tax=Gymnodinialimonas mytili TaxID=3126503 RepID=UPI0030A577B2